MSPGRPIQGLRRLTVGEAVAGPRYDPCGTGRRHPHWACLLALGCALVGGCATIKESDTARTGVEQLLISSAVDRALDKIDFRPIARGKIYVEEKYLDCTDKNYVLIALHQRLLQQNCTLVGKPEDSDVTLEIASGSVGTDRHDLFMGVPQIPLPPPSPISIPKMTLYERNKAMGTAKLAIVAYDTKSRASVINSGSSLARTDYKNYTVVGTSGVESGSVEEELAAATGQHDSPLYLPTAVASRPSSAGR
jgi:hypothetical protein